jgi:hypothetical protein
MGEKKTVCTICENATLTKNEVGLCKKMLGIKTESYFCTSCLADYLDTTIEDLNAKIEDFKVQGCVLFT